MATSSTHTANKRLIYDGFNRIASAEGPALEQSVASLYATTAHASLFHPLDEAQGIPALVERLWRPLKASFPDLSRTDTLVAAGTFAGQDMVACLGHYVGTFHADWLSVPANHKVVWLRFGEAHVVVEGRVARSWVLIDVLDLMRQVGVWPLAPMLGAGEVWPAPARGGPAVDTFEAAGGERSLKLVLAMHGALGSFDGVSVRSMDQARYWAEHFMWYGPSGIGTTRGMDGFRAHHQVPFLTAFPDRRGGQHYIRIGDGPFVVTGGWPSVTATHTGDGFLGLPASGKRVGMRVMDFYRCGEHVIEENWVPIDILDLVKQMGVDLLGRLKHLRGAPMLDLASGA